MFLDHTLFISPLDSTETHIFVDADAGQVYLTQYEVDDDREDEIAINIDELEYIVELARRMRAERVA